MTNSTVTLLDGIDANREHPDTFHIPHAEERGSLTGGQLAKLCFLHPDTPLARESMLAGERMWVRVEECMSDGRYIGTLVSQPFGFEAETLAYGDTVTFEPRHVIGVYDCREGRKPERVTAS
jgi:hypothetical protein